MRTFIQFTPGTVPVVDWLFLDLNSYFASVEQQERPELRGRPVGIVPQVCENTVCIAASYEAKAYGVKTGTNIADAKLLCPHIMLVDARPKLYVEYHHRIVEAVRSCIPVACVISIDEMACRLIGRERTMLNATAIAYEVKRALRTVGNTLRCSVGIAPNRYLAKVAADICKPDGLTVWLLEDLPHALFCLELSDLIGVGPAMEQRLIRQGIRSVKELCALSQERMRGIWHSVLGERLWHWLRGVDFNGPESKRQSVGKQHVLAPEFRTREKAGQAAMKLLHISAMNLRKYNMWAGGISVSVRFLRRRPARYGGDWVEAPSWEAHKRIQECRDTPTLQEHLLRLWQRCPPDPPMQLGVCLYGLIPDELHTLDLFGNEEKKYKLSAVVDELNRRFGRDTVHTLGVHDVLKSAPTRISYTSIPELWEF